MNKLYSKQKLLEELKNAKLPHSYPSLIRYERRGIVRRPKGEVHYKDRSWRFYTAVEIERIIQKIKKHLSK